jgi:hypothetical protein
MRAKTAGNNWDETRCCCFYLEICCTKLLLIILHLGGRLTYVQSICVRFVTQVLNEGGCLLDCYTVTRIKVYRRFGGTCCLRHQIDEHQ